MSRYPAFLLTLLFFIPAIAAVPEKPAKDTRVWVIDDTDKAHPLTGNLLSEGLDIYSGKAPSPGNYRLKNSIWDASTSTVRLFAGRNESVAFQVVMEKGRDDLHKVFVTATDLIGPAERISADSHIRLFKELYLKIDNEWYPDALVPFDINGIIPFDLPDYKQFPEQKTQAVWVDIYVPHELPSGIYTGLLNILHRAVNKQAVLRIELEVGNYTLSDTMNLAVDLMNYGFLNIERGWPDMILDSPRFRAAEREFYREAHAHRMTFNILPYNHDGMIPKGAKPELAGAGETIRVADWKSWDDRFGPVLSGEAFKDCPCSNQPVTHFFLPYNLMWPSDIRNWKKPEYRTEYLRISREFMNHLAEKGWTRPQYQIYYNHKEHYLFFPWNLDEPTRDEDLDALRYLGEILHESFPENNPVKVAYRLDIGHFYCENVPGCQSPRETSKVVIRTLGKFVDLWNIGSPHYWPNLPKVRELKNQGKTLYFYNGTPKVAEPLIKAVTWGWNGYKYEADGICFWNATDWTDWDTDEPPRDPYTNAGGRYGGFSMVFYPGARFGYDGPIAALRVKALRRGFQDFESVRLLEKKGLMNRGEIVKLADQLLLGEKTDYPGLRRIVFDKLNGK